ncbi:hypothetical protein [Natronobacterium gregoryi]|uniref:DUF456 domain-containing protein n=2 Tax=Natronobacterium gregoryi TaxID=44930 RepID=L0ADJ5_NATGS|nr:hypothetical protein [Natronobacterium gregoryi]AFZ71983.1 hypothetical protein Natgr_0741 [Natronobacterium gregoryi SP2]ELY62653.1 hypothetical protein C490_17559 [Natronobacterium gregoryi SP2]PLK20838.1 hypothetical protein CYV19_07090 [Natronobacterium gregoryi SP2]SFJ19471.1 hypothetical protein SAMN05443661_11721 [Natronobacterium gregoryi]
MSDRSDELTESQSPGSTDDLLEETDRLLEETGGEPGADSGAGPAASSTEPSGREQVDPSQESAADASGRSWLSRLVPDRPSLSVPREDLFSPKAFLAFVALVSVGLFAGNALIPVAGRLIGMFAIAFLVGLATSKRRYLEMTTAGVASGGATSLLIDPWFVAAGLGTRVLAVGAATGLVAALAGYYFGRDLRAGLARDVE